MYETKDEIKKQHYDKLQISKITKTDAFEILSITLEKDSIFPEHTSPTDANLIVLEGAIDFYIDGKTFRLSKQQHFNFPKEMVHWVEAKENSKFLIVR